MDIMRQMALENLYRNMPREYPEQQYVPEDIPQIDPREVDENQLIAPKNEAFDKRRLANNAREGFIQSLVMPILGPNYKKPNYDKIRGVNK